MARVSIQGKVTSKKISTWLKAAFECNSILAIAPPGDRHILTQSREDKYHLNKHHQHGTDGYLSDSSCASHGDMPDAFTNGFKRRRSLRRTVSLEDMTTASAIHHQRPASSASICRRRHPSRTDVRRQDQGQPHSTMNDPIGLPTPDVSPEELSESSEELVIIQGELLEKTNHTQSRDRIRPSQLHRGAFPESDVETRTISNLSPTGEPMAGPLNWLTEAPCIDALVNWIEGPDHPVQRRSQDKDKQPNPWLDIPLQFVELLTYPEPDPKNGNKMTLAMVRETTFVKQRRRTLLMLTAYTMIVRYCSFDFFIVVLFASNCAMLFLMKNSGRMNVNMAKRAVRQRVGWAKQWAGGIFRRGNNHNNSNSNGYTSANTNTSNTAGGTQHYSNSNSVHSPSTTEFAQDIQTLPAISGNISSIVTESNPQMKRRGLFGKRKTVDNTASSIHETFASTAPSIHRNAVAIGDTASIISAAPTGVTTTIQKRRFFKRNNNFVNSSSNYNHHQHHHDNNNNGARGNITHFNTDDATMPSVTNTPLSIPSKTSVSPSSTHSPTQSSAGTIPNTTRLTAMNTPLSSSSLTQSQSLPQLQLSPTQVDSERSKPTKSLSISSTSLSLLPSVPSAQQQRHDEPSSIVLPPVSSTSQSVSVVSQSSSLKGSGLSQLLDQSECTARDTPQRPLSPFGLSNQQNHDDHDEYEDGTAGDIDELGPGFDKSTKKPMGTDSTMERSNSTSLDAVASAAADAMDL
ncbi:hypothetical protein BGZ65_012977 [Modicella reniformis]|uniref:Uncharacterized protein n=1 Tax=Modicella reniformis TaxID=1440133 RepID=A0A9P6MAD0_9FUNG|nr:hypothetical protein BGZ65_012977 [Modicella reniformis]